MIPLKNTTKVYTHMAKEALKDTSLQNNIGCILWVNQACS